ncbi:hypothetical protein ATANTOWER_005188 [Ataeniobius toweri]|uniref:Uncharacterized protein n=1 Tax=Ataeniobius toweri TaxID=208326 RepID=A0ABU7AN56_9TELE|nr:hypothetical protein [Ataeniobius toweri]
MYVCDRGATEMKGESILTYQIIHPAIARHVPGSPLLTHSVHTASLLLHCKRLESAPNTTTQETRLQPKRCHFRNTHSRSLARTRSLTPPAYCHDNREKNRI